MIPHSAPVPASATPRSRRILWWLLVVALITAIGATVAVGAAQLQVKSRHPAPVAESASARRQVLDAAAEAAVKVLTYAPDTVEQDVATAEQYLTGDFLNYYRDYAQSAIVPATRGERVATSAKVLDKGLLRLTGDKAEVLLFIDQTTTSTTLSEPKLSQASLKVALTTVDGRWLVEKFDPV